MEIEKGKKKGILSHSYRVGQKNDQSSKEFRIPLLQQGSGALDEVESCCQKYNPLHSITLKKSCTKGGVAVTGNSPTSVLTKLLNL